MIRTAFSLALIDEVEYSDTGWCWTRTTEALIDEVEYSDTGWHGPEPWRH